MYNCVKGVNRILQNLILASGQKILPEKTLIIFDEIQDCPNVINSLKYFCENAPKYHLACAGSLLGIALANGDENLAAYLDTVNTLEPIPDAFFNPLYEKLKMYYVTGGMPEREYEDALQWLADARLVHKIYRSSAPGLPICAYDDLSAFKIYLVDVGLLRRLAMLAPTAFGEGNRLFTE